MLHKSCRKASYPASDIKFSPVPRFSALDSAFPFLYSSAMSFPVGKPILWLPPAQTAGWKWMIYKVPSHPTHSRMLPPTPASSLPAPWPSPRQLAAGAPCAPSPAAAALAWRRLPAAPPQPATTRAFAHQSQTRKNHAIKSFHPGQPLFTSDHSNYGSGVAGGRGKSFCKGWVLQHQILNAALWLGLVHGPPSILDFLPHCSLG